MSDPSNGSSGSGAASADRSDSDVPQGGKGSPPSSNRVRWLKVLAPDEAIRLLREAERPVIIVGHGARFNMDRITALAERLRCPVITTFKAKGVVSDTHPLGCGVLGRSGTPITSWFMNESDLLLVLGASFSNHTGITPKKPTIQVDFDPMALGKFHAVDVTVWGEIGVTVDRFAAAYPATALASHRYASYSDPTVGDAVIDRT